MDREFMENMSKYTDSRLYNRLAEISETELNSHLGALVKVARSEKEKMILEMIDVLLEFVCNEEVPSAKEKIVETAVDDLLPILNTRDSNKITELISDEYSTVLHNLEEIAANSEPEIASKCLFGQAILTFPGSKIIDENTGLDY